MGIFDSFLAPFGLGGDDDAPPAPDYSKAAIDTTEGDIQTAIVTALLNNPQFSTPYGKQTYTENGSREITLPDGRVITVPTFAINQELTPEGQALQDQDVRIAQGLGDVAEGSVGRVGETLGTPFESNRDTSRQRVEDALFSKAMSRINPAFDAAEEKLDVKLANQGITLGSKPYAEATRILGESRNDATNQSIWDSINAGGNEASRTFGEETYLRGLPLNELNALRTGAQVNQPTLPGYNANANISGPDMLGAAGLTGQNMLDKYNTNAASQGQLIGGLSRIGASWIGK